MDGQVHMMIFLLVTLNLNIVSGQGNYSSNHSSGIVIVKVGVINEQISKDWKNAIESRMTPKELDSMSSLKRPLTNEENSWIKLIKSKTNRWNLFRDSLATPFSRPRVTDTVCVLLGAFGVDDAFTYKYNTVCFDLTALQRVYGNSYLPENQDKIDRIFAHEFTHLLHKDWVSRNKFLLKTFKDSVLWECLYEGIGMYRSLPKKWLPQNGVLPEISKNALDELCPIFVDRLTTIESSGGLSEADKNRIRANLSRGTVSKKWGAFTVAMWLALEANGDDRKLTYWINGNVNSIIILARKYLTGSNKEKFEKIFPSDVKH